VTTDTAATERTQAALRAAHLYYFQDLTMEAIARELHTSRSSVSRLLSQARASGLVDIRIQSPAEARPRLATELRERFAVTAHLVPVPDQTGEVERLERVALSAARLLPQWFGSNSTLGLAWGSTIGAVSRNLVAKELQNAQVVQLNGAANPRTTGVTYASEILRRFGTAFGARVEEFPVPAFFDDPATKAALWRERSVRRVLDLQAKSDLVLVGLGSPLADGPGHGYLGGCLDRADHASLRTDRVAGDVATVFYRMDGTYRDIALNARGSGPDLGQLRRIPRRVGVVAGLGELAALRGALAAHLLTDVVLDEGLARALLAPPERTEARRGA
jgi:deoxyribonucleoside regulator